MYNERWEERAADNLTTRNNLVKHGADLTSPAVLTYEEKAANALSRAKRG